MIVIAATAGCTTAPTLPSFELPKLTEEQKTGGRPADCAWPDFVQMKISGDDYAALDQAGFMAYLACVTQFDRNVKIANANADGLEAIAEMYEGAGDIWNRQKGYAEFAMNEMAIDRREAKVETWTYKGVLALVLIGVALSQKTAAIRRPLSSFSYTSLAGGTGSSSTSTLQFPKIVFHNHRQGKS